MLGHARPTYSYSFLALHCKDKNQCCHQHSSITLDFYAMNLKSMLSSAF
jgi:hypothetical protein